MGEGAMKNDPNNEFVQFVEVNGERIAAKVELSIKLRRALEGDVLSWDEAEKACGVEGMVLYNLLHGREDGFEVADLERMAAAVDADVDAKRGIVCWVPEDELPESLSQEAYDALYEHSRVNIIRWFPVFVPVAAERV
jgi:hypothetical protein